VIDRKKLLEDLKPQVRKLEDDLRAQITEVLDVYERLKAEYREAFEVERTAATWETWRDERVTQAAVAWVLGTVFVRFCEDNRLLERPFLAGPTSERMTLAEEAQEQFFREHPEETDRGWMLAAFDAIQSAVEGGTKGVALFSQRHNPLYQLPVSHDAAKALIAFWRRREESGELVHDFRDPNWDTRFLGDLYQDLSEAARENYALLQTPEFVEEFILDLTLTPAIEEFGLEEVKLIDPTCGSGHFLLEAFERLVKAWEKHAPPRNAHERVRRALEAVYGVDINPFAVAVARFRLLVAALRAAGIRTLEEAAGYSLPVSIAVGDSLIKARQLSLFYDKRDKLAEFAYETEDIQEYPGILEPGQYHVVVGNPPYVTVTDKALNQHYRKLYDACSRKYALSVPFAQRFFELASASRRDGHGAGYVGQITANSFMKREFGKKLIEEFFADKVELTHVIDTSGAYIPGHGTPTVIIVGRREARKRADTVRAVLGIRGESGVPDDPSEGTVWRAIVDQVRDVGSESEWISVLALQRGEFARHPWSLSGGGAGELLDSINRNSVIRLGAKVFRIGFFGVIGFDDVAMASRSVFSRARTESTQHAPLVIGDEVRDWGIAAGDDVFYPYDGRRALISLDSIPKHADRIWPFRTELGNRATFSRGTYFADGRPWYEWHQLPKDQHAHPWALTFAFVASHNHFVVDHGRKAYNRSAPVIKLPEDASEDDHLRLLGPLNSSTACFWLKQVSQPKGGDPLGDEGARVSVEQWSDRYEFTGTKLEDFPLPSVYPLDLARRLDMLARQINALTPMSLVANETPSQKRLVAVRGNWHSTRARMIALQEELDWQVYALYGLLDEELTAPPDSVPELRFGERAFEIVLARKMAVGEVETQWFARHGSTPITEIPAHWPEDYKALVEKRIAVIEHNRQLALIERPECKRRWATDGWDKMEARALRGWLLDRCESRDLWYREVDGIEQPRTMTAARIAHEIRRNPDVVAVADLYAPGKDFTKVIEELVAEEHVPYLAALRYKEPGLEKRAQREYVWEQQRNEDAAPDEVVRAKIRSQIPVPPKYKSSDFLKTSYWRHRGKLDIPKERFISYPGASRDGDPSLLLGWAGWDHREQAQALATLIGEREAEDGWGADRLTPLLAGLREVMPWVWQWHGDFDPAYGDSPAKGYDAFLTSCRERLHLTEETLAAWRPPKPARGRKKKS
jgi:hypothetical protein